MGTTTYSRIYTAGWVGTYITAALVIAYAWRTRTNPGLVLIACGIGGVVPALLALWAGIGLLMLVATLGLISTGAMLNGASAEKISAAAVLMTVGASLLLLVGPGTLEATETGAECTRTFRDGHTETVRMNQGLNGSTVSTGGLVSSTSCTQLNDYEAAAKRGASMLFGGLFATLAVLSPVRVKTFLLMGVLAAMTGVVGLSSGLLAKVGEAAIVSGTALRGVEVARR